MNNIKDRLFSYFHDSEYSDDLNNHIKDILVDKIHRKFQHIIEEELKNKLSNKLKGDFDE